MDLVWMPFVRSPNDNWAGITDLRERKRRQGRLAQRARRARKVAARRKESSIDDSAPQDEHSLQEPQGQSTHKDGWRNAEGDVARSLEIVPLQFEQADTTFDCLAEPAVSNGEYNTYEPNCDIGEKSIVDSVPSIIMPCQTVITALWMNADLLKLRCSTSPNILTLDPSIMEAPPSLSPTILQGLVPHMPLIDCIPFPSVRDRILLAGSLIPFEVLQHDIVQVGLKCWGRRPWDARGWELSEEFADKWWWILDEEIIAMTNYWREERAIKPLIWKGKITTDSRIRETIL
ncbi:hypothetical protein F5884DRAFT_760232 [Xylogone sp. PMI_703]|nr:hypothetical protein F5884DRAFT_760232 [Xylogone sp. PMI_703]